MAVYRIRELLIKPPSGKRKSVLPIEESEATFSAEDIHFIDQQYSRQKNSVRNSTNSHRFYDKEQLSVHDFLRHRPSLRRYKSSPEVKVKLGYPIATQATESEEGRRKRRSYSCGSKVVDDEEDDQVSYHSEHERSLSVEHSPSSTTNSLTRCRNLDDEKLEVYDSPELHVLSETSGAMEYGYQESLASKGVHGSGCQEDEYRDSRMPGKDVTVNTQVGDRIEEYPNVHVNESEVTFSTTDSCSHEESVQYHSPVNSMSSINTYSDENERELCMSVPTLTLASNLQPKPMVLAKACSSSFTKHAGVSAQGLEESGGLASVDS